MNSFQLGLMFNVDQKNFSPNKTYKLLGTLYDNGQFRLCFADDFRSIWWVSHEKCKISVDEFVSAPLAQLQPVEMHVQELGLPVVEGLVKPTEVATSVVESDTNKKFKK